MTSLPKEEKNNVEKQKESGKFSSRQTGSKLAANAGASCCYANCGSGAFPFVIAAAM